MKVVDPELETVAAQLAAARKPEDVFGVGVDEAAARRVYRRLAVATHPDRHNGSAALAGQTFAKLNGLWALAEQAFRAGTYGTARSRTFDPFTLRSKKHAFEAAGLWRKDEISNLYHATVDDDADAILRVVRKPRDNDLLQNEQRKLKMLLDATDERWHPFLPGLIDGFGYKQQTVMRRVNAFTLPPNLYTLEALMDAWPQGYHPKHMAWIWRRLLVAIGVAHSAGIVHGAIIPSNVLVEPEQHGLVLFNWSSATTDDERVVAINQRYRNLYAPEILAKEKPRFETDLYMGAQTMLAFMGKHDVPAPLRAHFTAAGYDDPRIRPDDAWLYKDAFDEALERCYGPRRFTRFAMPPNVRETTNKGRKVQ